MNFNYSYKAFLITSLLFGILFLLMYSINLSRYKEEVIEEYDIEYAEEKILAEEEDIAITTPELVKVETNRAYNEAEKFMKQIENQRDEVEENTESKLAEIDAAIKNTSANESGIEKAREAIKANKEKLARNNESTSKSTAKTAANRNTTISYRLVNRKSLFLPNPVYTCEGGGKVVINIEVDLLGKIRKASYNRSASTTTNECLIDSALEYASRARFTTSAGADDQLGTITYNFPGQQ
jgi:hypothetical protein